MPGLRRQGNPAAPARAPLNSTTRRPVAEMPVLTRHMLRPKPSIQAGHDQLKTALEMRVATQALPDRSDEQTGTWQFN